MTELELFRIFEEMEKTNVVVQQQGAALGKQAATLAKTVQVLQGLPEHVVGKIVQRILSDTQKPIETLCEHATIARTREPLNRLETSVDQARRTLEKAAALAKPQGWRNVAIAFLAGAALSFGLSGIFWHNWYHSDLQETQASIATLQQQVTAISVQRRRR